MGHIDVSTGAEFKRKLEKLRDETEASDMEEIDGEKPVEKGKAKAKNSKKDKRSKTTTSATSSSVPNTRASRASAAAAAATSGTTSQTSAKHVPTTQASAKHASPIEEDERTQAVDDAANILSSFVGAEPEQALTRTFSFPFLGSKADTIEVELNDAPLLSGDHTSVGLQSWASSIILSERMCAQPATFRLDANSSRSGGRILELGAGTGLLSISAAKILQRYGALENTTIVATDFHPDVLANLRRNVDTNFTSFHNAIDVRCLDWEHPDLTAPFDKPFDIILAADVVYHPSHAAWIKACVYSLLAKPTATGAIGGVFWLIVALRASGRHEGVANTVNDVFPSVQDVRLSRSSEWELAVLHQQRLERQGGIGRADEGGYKLFEIGWVRS